MISISGISFAMGAIAFALVSLRFFQYWQHERSLTAYMLFWFTFSFFVFFAYTAIISLFLYSNALALKTAVVIAVFFQGLGCSFLWTVFWHIRMPYASLKKGFFVMFGLTLVATVMSILMSYSPAFDEKSLTVFWNVPPLLGILRAFIFLSGFISLGVTFIRQGLVAADPIAKSRGIGLGVLLFTGFIGGSLDFLLEEVIGFGPRTGDIVLGVTYFLLILIVFFIPHHKTTYSVKPTLNE